MADGCRRLRRAALAALCLGLGACSTVGDVKDATLDWYDEKPAANLDGAKDFAESSAAEDSSPRFFSFDLVRVKPWEREVLGRPDMAWEPAPQWSTQRSHIFFSKEGSLIGGSAGGGGCGCN
jgi:hypothetical protein